MSFNPASCPINSKYYYQDFSDNQPSAPSDWVLDTSGYSYGGGPDLVSSFTDNGWRIDRAVIVQPPLYQLHLLSNSTIANIDLTGLWEYRMVCHVPMGSHAMVHAIGIPCGIRSNNLYPFQTPSYGFIYSDGVGSLPAEAIADDFIFDVRMVKYETGALGAYRYTVNGVVVHDGAPWVGAPWGTTHNLNVAMGENQLPVVFENLYISYIYLVQKDMPSDCEGLISAEASVSEGEAPLTVQFTDTSEIA